jgi:hypothetical protein
MRRRGGGTNLLPFDIGTGACNGPLLVPGRIPALWAGGVKVEITVTPDAHAHVPPPPCRAPRPIMCSLLRDRGRLGARGILGVVGRPGTFAPVSRQTVPLVRAMGALRVRRLFRGGNPADTCRSNEVLSPLLDPAGAYAIPSEVAAHQSSHAQRSFGRHMAVFRVGSLRHCPSYRPGLHRGRRSCRAPVGARRFVIRATHERGVGVPSSRSLATATREANSVYEEAPTCCRHK